MGVNVVCISGNLTREPELKKTAGGLSVLNFSVAVNDYKYNRETENTEQYTNYVDCVLFGRRAESIVNMLHKGVKVAIDGKLHYSSWKTQEGNKRSKIDVTVDNIDITNSKPSQQQAQQPQQQQEQKAVQQTLQQAAYNDDDIPF